MVGATPLIAPAAPKNARSKRAALAREPVAVEKGAKTAIFVRGSSISEKVKVALSELVSVLIESIAVATLLFFF